MQKLRIKIAAEQECLRLDQAIAASTVAKEYSFSRGLIRKLIMAGAVYLNGKRIRVASRTVRKDAVVEIYYDASRTPAASAKGDVEKFLPLRVLYQDDAIICFDKPAGLPTQPTLDDARANLYALAKKENPYLGMHHRLDRDTSGVVLFTRDQKHNEFVARQFRDHLVSKLYVAVVEGRLSRKEGRIESFLAETSRVRKQARFGSVRSGGKKAITDYSVLETGAKYSLVEVSILTGRTHQIRVHFSEMGHPVVGDKLYGTASSVFSRHLLHAHALTIEHPITHNRVRIESPLPEIFRQCVHDDPSKR